MKPAPISLLDYFVAELSFTANPEFVDSKPSEASIGDGDFRAEVAVLRQAEARHWQVVLEVKQQAAANKNCPYSFRVKVVGLFLAAESVPAQHEERTAKIHGASVLYGVTREVVRAVTGRGPHRAVLIPTVSFYETPPTPKLPEPIAADN